MKTVATSLCYLLGVWLVALLFGHPDCFKHLQPSSYTSWNSPSHEATNSNKKFATAGRCHLLGVQAKASPTQLPEVTTQLIGSVPAAFSIEDTQVSAIHQLAPSIDLLSSTGCSTMIASLGQKKEAMTSHPTSVDI